MDISTEASRTRDCAIRGGMVHKSKLVGTETGTHALVQYTCQVHCCHLLRSCNASLFQESHSVEIEYIGLRSSAITYVLHRPLHVEVARLKRFGGRTRGLFVGNSMLFHAHA